MSDFNGKRVIVMGLGLFGGGVAVTRFLARHGARVTVTDLKSESKLAVSLEKLRGVDVRFVLGRHVDSDFTDTDLVIVNPAVPRDSPYLKLAREHGVPFETETNLFFKLCPAPIIGVTGSNGKTTTTTLIGEMLRDLGLRVYVGGNIGAPLIERVEEMAAESFVVLELSSFQLEDLRAIKRSPHISVVTNISPNHLDRHKTMENYIAAKRAIVDYQRDGDIFVVNARDDRLASWAEAARAHVLRFSSQDRVREGTYLDGSTLRFRIGYDKGKICDRDDILLPGIFNVENFLAASAAALALGVRTETIRRVARTFRGVTHRLELFHEEGGVRYYNDSIATTPESTIAALDALEGPIILIAGGYDKKVPLSALARKIADRCKAVILVGTIGPQIAAELRRCENADALRVFEEGTDFEAAAGRATSLAEPGGCVLLSPATASYDMFANFEERGDTFKRLVNPAAAGR